MKYRESKEILEKIKLAESVLLNCHSNPDADSIGSALAMDHALKQLGKSGVIICPDKIPDEFNFLPGFKNILQEVDFSNYAYDKFDLFLILDCANEKMISSGDLPGIPNIVIDHHATNTNFGEINLIDGEISSVSEILFDLFTDWDIEITKDISNCLLTGIVGDTGGFQFHAADSETLSVASKLLKLGADKDEIILNIFRRNSFKKVKLTGFIVSNANKESNFVWSLITNKSYVDYGSDPEAKGLASSTLLRQIDGIDFIVVIIETEPSIFSVSFRSRNTDFDVSEVASELGGGGHKNAAGAMLKDIEVDEAKEKVLIACRKYAK